MQAVNKVQTLLTLFEVATVNRAVLEAALTTDFTDFEDAVIHEAARHTAAGAIVTRNARDFAKASIPIYVPDELIKMLLARRG